MWLHHSFVFLWNEIHWKIAVYLEQQLLLWKKGNSILGVIESVSKQESERTFVFLYVCVQYVWSVMSSNYHWKIVIYTMDIFMFKSCFISHCYKYSIDLWRFVCCANTSFSYTSWDSCYPYNKVHYFADILWSRHMALITSALRTCYFTFAASVVNKKKKTQKEKSVV